MMIRVKCNMKNKRGFKKAFFIYIVYNYFFILHLFLLCMHYLFLVWTVYEQVCIAALDCQRIDISEVNT